MDDSGHIALWAEDGRCVAEVHAGPGGTFSDAMNRLLRVEYERVNMRISEEQLAAEQENRRKAEAGEWFPTRWWRVVLEDGSLWCETSSEAEARERVPKGATVQHLFEKHKRQWRDA